MIYSFFFSFKIIPIYNPMIATKIRCLIIFIFVFMHSWIKESKHLTSFPKFIKSKTTDTFRTSFYSTTMSCKMS